MTSGSSSYVRPQNPGTCPGVVSTQGTSKAGAAWRTHAVPGGPQTLPDLGVVALSSSREARRGGVGPGGVRGKAIPTP